MKKVKHALLSIIAYLFEYLTVFATIFASAYIVISSQFVQYDTNTLLLWIIGLLALIASSQVAEKFLKLNVIEKEIKSLSSFICKTKTNITSRRELPRLEKLLANAKTVTITGGSLKRVSDACYGDLENLLNNGCKLEVIMVNPDSKAADFLCDNVVYETNDYAEFRESIRKSMNRFLTLKNKYGKKIEIRISDRVPPFSLMVKNEKSDDAYVKVELYSYRVPTGDRKQLIFSKKDDREDFDFFIEQLRDLRNTSTII